MTQNKCILIIVVYCFVFLKGALGLCPNGYFKINSMKYCHPWLTCKDIKNVKISKLVGFGSTKTVYLAEWKEHNISFSSLRNKHFQYDFYHGLHILKTIGQSKYILQLVGFCEMNDVIITEYHEHNNALNYDFLRQTLSLKQKFDTCINFVEIINYLHNSPIGTRVNCDSNDLGKLLSQLLITKDFNIILGDVDTLPELRVNSTIKCGVREIKSSFAAPEQIWRKSEPFRVEYMNGYDEKIDIWKIPDVCSYFLDGPDYELLQYRLFHLHQNCKNVKPQNRPSAKHLVQLYKHVRDLYI